MDNLIDLLADIVTAEHVLTGDAIDEDYTHDEALTVEPHDPQAVVRPATTEQVSRVLRLANEAGIPVTARGSGTGLSGACIPSRGGIVLSFERMNRVLEIDTENHVAVVEPGVTLAELDEATSEHGLIYPIFPGESSATLGGNIATNAGGMRAVKYGVTRHHVLGLEAVLADGQIIQTGGKLVKASTGYDLTQLIIGSEGTLAVVTRIILKLIAPPAAPVDAAGRLRVDDEVTHAVPKLVATGIGPLMVEYIDKLTMVGITRYQGIELGIDEAVQEKALAYLLMVVEGRSDRTRRRGRRGPGEAVPGPGRPGGLRDAACRGRRAHRSQGEDLLGGQGGRDQRHHRRGGPARRDRAVHGEGARDLARSTPR